MKYIFLLSGDYIELAKKEVLSLFDIDESKLLNNLLITNLNDDSKSLNNIFPRLALTKYIYRFLFECKTDDLIKIMKNFDWNSVYKGNFCLRIDNFGKNPINEKNIKKNSIKLNQITKTFTEKKLAAYIWHKLSKPKVNLENPKTLIQFFTTKNKAYCGLLVFENKEGFEKRKSHLRPFPHPSSLHPKIARALVNISGIKENEILLDPFCGTGGFLIEAGLMNIKSIGYDINKIMINGCKENLKHFGIKNSKIKFNNALNLHDKFDYVVTDLPYGLNSNVLLKYEADWKRYRINRKIETKNFIKNLESFYLKFLKNLRKRLEKKAVIVFPDYVDYKKLLKLSKFKIEKEFEQYVHRSLKRKIVKIG